MAQGWFPEWHCWKIVADPSGKSLDHWECALKGCGSLSLLLPGHEGTGPALIFLSWYVTNLPQEQKLQDQPDLG